MNKFQIEDKVVEEKVAVLVKETRVIKREALETAHGDWWPRMHLHHTAII